MRAILIATFALWLCGDDNARGDNRPKSQTFPVHFSSLAVSPDGKILVLGGKERADVYDRKTMKWKYWMHVTRTVVIRGVPKKFEGLVTSIAFSPDGKQLALLHQHGHIQIHDVSTGRFRRSITFPRTVEAVAGIAKLRIVYSPNGKQIALVCPDVTIIALEKGGGFCVLFESRTGKHLKTVGGVSAVVAARDGRFLAVQTQKAKNKSTRPHILDLTTGRVVRNLPLDKPLSISDAAFSRDGRFVAIIGHLQIAVWNVKTGQRHFSYSGNKKEVFDRGVAFSGNGKFLVAASIDTTEDVTGNLLVIDVATGRVVRREERPVVDGVPRVLGSTADGSAIIFQFGDSKRVELYRFPDPKPASQ